MKVSLIVTVKNEQHSVGRLLDSILSQRRLPDEVVLADGGSTDSTLPIARSFMDRLPLRVLSVPGANISEGRNAAIRESTGDIIAVTDAGVVLDKLWLEELVKPFEGQEVVDNPSPVDVVCGFFRSHPHGVFETALGATTLPAIEEVLPEHFLPSSRSVAFSKRSWFAVGGYPEWLDYCEDLVFDIGLKRRQFNFRFAPGAIVYFRPRSSLKSFFKQYYHYARGDGKAGLWRKRHIIRYGTYVSTALLASHAMYRRQPWLFLFPIVGAALYVRRPYLRLSSDWGELAPHQKVSAVLSVPVIRFVGDIAKMLGYPVGLWWRLTNR